MEPTISDNDKFSPFKIVIVGGGLSGCMSAALLARLTTARPLQISIFEYRSDPRSSENAGRGRSINLAISARGVAALRRIGLESKVKEISVPMHGRLVHDQKGGTSIQPYGQRDQHLLSVSRAELNRILLNACELHENVTIHFKSKCTDIDLEHSRVSYINMKIKEMPGDSEPESEQSVVADLIIGADGTYSRVRAAMERCVPRFDYSREHISAMYKELAIPKQDDGIMPQEWLHVWPRHNFMLIALPNVDGSFTSTLFMDAERFDQLHNEGQDAVVLFFKEQFPDALGILPDVGSQFMQSSTSPLLTVRCEPYCFKDNAVLVGDAAHAIVPFYGQGCNAAFEDCVQLADEIECSGLAHMSRALRKYSENRKPNADAIADLAVAHYHDMAAKSASSIFALRRRLEIFLHKIVPSRFTPLYTMITFTTIPYADAVKRAKSQDFAMKCGLGLSAAVVAISTVTTGIMFLRAKKLGVKLT